MVGLRLIIRLNCGFGLVRDGVFGVDDDNVLICENNGDRSKCKINKKHKKNKKKKQK